MTEEFHKPAREGDRFTGAVEPSDVLEACDDSLDIEGEIYTTIAFDPGGTTGWAVVCAFREAIERAEFKILENILYWSAGEFAGPLDPQVDAMLGLVEAWPDARLVMESFILRQFNMSAELLHPVRVAEKFAYGLHLLSLSQPCPVHCPPPEEISKLYDNPEFGGAIHGGLLRPVNMQQPSLAMSAITDDRLRQYGFWAPLTGKPHARDAMKHALTWMRRAKAMHTNKKSAPAE